MKSTWQQQVRIAITDRTAAKDQLKAIAERFAVFLRKGAGLKVAVGGEGKEGESEIKLRVAIKKGVIGRFSSRNMP